MFQRYKTLADINNSWESCIFCQFISGSWTSTFRTFDPSNKWLHVDRFKYLFRPFI